MDTEPSTDEWAGLDEIFGEHDGKLHRFILSKVRQVQPVEDLCAQTWLVFASRWETYRTYAAPAAPLYVIAGFKSLQWTRRRTIVEELWCPEDLAGTSSLEDLQSYRDLGGLSEAERVHIRTDLERAIADLPPRQQEAFLLHHDLDLDLETIAGYMAIGCNGVKKLLTEARRSLRRMPGLAGYTYRRRKRGGKRR